MKILIIITAILSIFTSQNFDNAKIAIETENIGIYTTNNLTMEMLETRNGKIIIEIVFGIVETAAGDGRVLDIGENEGYYISYARVDNAKIGDFVLTILIYNPDNNFYDDVILRYDYLIQ